MNAGVITVHLTGFVFEKFQLTLKCADHRWTLKHKAGDIYIFVTVNSSMQNQQCHVYTSTRCYFLKRSHVYTVCFLRKFSLNWLSTALTNHIILFVDCCTFWESLYKSAAH